MHEVLDVNQLAARPVEELQDLCRQRSIQYHHKNNPASLAAKLVEHETHRQNMIANAAARQQADLRAPAEMPQEPLLSNTTQQILDVVQPFLDAGLDVSFPGDGTWVFKRGIKVESGNMAIPLRIIRMKAESVMARPRQFATAKSAVDGKDVMLA